MIPSGRIILQVQKLFPGFGVNKLQEIARLSFEISGIRRSKSLDFLRRFRCRDFSAVKAELLRLRYPLTLQNQPDSRFYLPRLDIDPAARLQPGDRGSSAAPRQILVEKGLERQGLVLRLKKTFPFASVAAIPSLKSFLAGRDFTAGDYNRRKRCFFVVRQRYDFCKPCPCTASAVGCGYNLLNIGFGCGYDCAYCFLQSYQNLPGILFPDRLDGFFDAFRRARLRRGIFGSPRIGTGEFTDSLLYDHLTGFSGELIDFFRRRPDVCFEFKTKSGNVSGILDCRPAENIVVSWSLNPAGQARLFEDGAPSPLERIEAAVKCAAAGFRVGFHFDPIIAAPGWESGYSRLVERVFQAIPAKRIAWISLGTLRCEPGLKKIAENRFPGNPLFDGEMVIGFDEKLRYPSFLRDIIYGKMQSWIRRHDRSVQLYLCMEEAPVWRSFRDRERACL